MKLFRSSMTKIVSEAEFRQDFRRQVIITSDMSVGRSKERPLIGRHSQITPTVAKEIATALFNRYGIEGRLLEDKCNYLEQQVPRDQWATKQVNAMSVVDRGAEDNDPFARYNKMFKGLIVIATTNNTTKKKELARIYALGATLMELHAALNARQDRASNENRRNDHVLDTLHAVIKSMNPGESVEDAWHRRTSSTRGLNQRKTG